MKTLCGDHPMQSVFLREDAAGAQIMIQTDACVHRRAQSRKTTLCFNCIEYAEYFKLHEKYIFVQTICKITCNIWKILYFFTKKVLTIPE